MKLILLRDHTYGKKGDKITVADEKSTYLIQCGIAKIDKK
jgi:ribosomal protein L9